MKITKSQLKQIIREELENVVEESDLDNDGQSDAEEAYRIAFANYAKDLINQKFEKAKANFNPNRYDPESVNMLFNIENEVIDKLSNMMSDYVRTYTEKNLASEVDALRNPSRG